MASPHVLAPGPRLMMCCHAGCLYLHVTNSLLGRILPGEEAVSWEGEGLGGSRQ